MGILTLQMLKDMKPGVFAKGEIIDGPEGINIMNTKRMLRWVASRGKIYDWAIYVLFADRDWQEVKDFGDKIFIDENIRKLVPCDDEAIAVYRY
jgi:hypothetical protein